MPETKEPMPAKSKINNDLSKPNTAVNSYYDNMLSLIFNSENNPKNSSSGVVGVNSGAGAVPVVSNSNAAGGFELFSISKNTITIQKPTVSSKQQQQQQHNQHQQLHQQQQQQQANASNLSNFLNVRFEITQNLQPNQESSQASKTSSKSSKYRKSIKISSVSCRPLSALDSGDTQIPDIQLKSYEFTEKCLSFRLASIDLNGEQQQRKNFQVNFPAKIALNLNANFLKNIYIFNLKSIR